MKIAVVGTGYVGLVTGTCLADSGNDVVCIDIDREKIERLSRGETPIYEPGLEELIERSQGARRLRFTTDLGPAVHSSRLILLAIGTPPAADGSADLSTLWTVVDQIAPHLTPKAIVITKSTVPVGTCGRIESRLKELTGRDCDVASNPEFLKEGAAIDDFMKPDRVVVGVRNARVAEVLRGLYAPFLRTEKPFLVMSPESAEMTKYVANGLLATKISFINEVANLCERMSADIDDVRRGIGHDSRIGFAFLFPGAGYGGSCFPKDVQALASMARQHKIEPRILDAVHEVNRHQKTVLGHKIASHFGGNLLGRTIAVWGLSFKPKTDDIRDAPALVLIDRLLELGATVRAHDPEAMDNVRRLYGDKHGNRLQFAPFPLDALDGADALAIVTEWPEFRHPDFEELARRMKGRVIFDGRNLFNPATLAAAGFTYHCIGKAPVSGE
jgi:UDPglucose 6-dehydrogenase